MNWISVKGSLPEVGQKVLVYLRSFEGRSSSAGVYMGHRSWRANEWAVDDVYCEDAEPVSGDEVTHWMPLPEEPNGKQFFLYIIFAVFVVLFFNLGTFS